nr:MAG TPA: hypothetical protein [Caudoviricetes sp.]
MLRVILNRNHNQNSRRLSNEEYRYFSGPRKRDK